MAEKYTSAFSTPQSMSTIKSKLLKPALTSHFSCEFFAPPAVTSPAWFGKKRTAFNENGKVFDDALISLSCCDATLPGSTFYTHDVMDYTGVTEKIPYRRVYDDRADFTFYVDGNYEIIKYFEFWMQYIANEQYTNEYNGRKLTEQEYSYRMNYPDGSGDPKKVERGYRTQIYITKFERSHGKISGEKDKLSQALTYRYIDAYPTAIMSMPVSYESSQLLKCTVSFAYTRYILLGSKLNEIDAPNPEPQNPTPKFGPAFDTNQQFFDELNRR